MRKITIEQSHALMAILAQNVDWASLDMDVLQDAVVRSPQDAGLRFTEWLKNGGKSQTVVLPNNFPMWKTIKLGGYKTAYDLRKAISDAGMKIGDWANDILDKPDFMVSSEETDIELVRPSVAELGFRDGAIRKDIYRCAQALGLELCPPEVSPQLRLQYKDQPKGEWILVGMEPIAGSGGCLSVFDVGHGGGGLWLDGSSGLPDDFWGPGRRWVFLRRKAAKA